MSLNRMVSYLSLFLFSFFFYRYGDHRDLHSFPTRRSSDLVALQRKQAAVAELEALDGQVAEVADEERRLSVAGQQRSEEHTSELQSLTNLVCRLLLEKKKKATKDTTTRGRKE